MDHIKDSVIIFHINDFDHSVAIAATEHDPRVFSVTPLTLCEANDMFGFLRRNAVPGDVADIPRVPAELDRHE
jgi:hypothetical protein